MEYNDTNLLELVKQGFSQTKIAKEFGVSRGKISRRLKIIVENPSVLEKKDSAQKPNKYTFSFKKHSYKTKAEMYDDLREAVKNTK